MKRYILIALGCITLIGCATTPSTIIPPAPQKVESALPEVKKASATVDAGIKTNLNVGQKIKEQTQTIKDQRESIDNAIALADSLKVKLDNKTLVEKDATDLIDELSKVKSRNMFLELENTDLSKLKDEQELNLENMKNSLTKAEGLVIGKENEANELRTQNDFLGKNLATKNKENEKLVKEAATANVYKHAIWWAIGLFLLYTILKNVLMIYFPAIRFRV